MTHKTTVFLASSSELKAERAALEQRVNRLNKDWHDAGIFLHLEIWEDFIDAVSRTRLQDEYNRAIERADLFVLLVHTKVGKYSHEELKTALARFDSTGKPLVYTYFRSPPGPGEPDPGPQYDTVRKLRRALDRRGHFITVYDHLAELLDHFTRQMHKLRDQGRIAAATPHTGLAGGHLQATATGSGVAAAGSHAQAVSGRGVAIGGHHHGDIVQGPKTVHVHRGGPVFNGPVTVNHGDVVAGDKVVHAALGSRPGLPEISQQLADAGSARLHPDDLLAFKELLAALPDQLALAPREASAAPLARLLQGIGQLAASQPAALQALANLKAWQAWRVQPAVAAALDTLGAER